ncbi:MAG: hypothetical protein BAJALOKI2v1_70016 [Promethearchaeota archaeon]|nr:MAG: hypothetical protein BAJALOKI2v1_70016 [Candidatus Lokiarchaeota archaeon]
MHKDIESAINTWNRQMTSIKKEVDELIDSLSYIVDDKSKIETFFKISKELKRLSVMSEHKVRMIEQLIKLYDQKENQLILKLNKEHNQFQWKSIFYLEKGRSMIKKLNLIPVNYQFFNDIFVEYYWFIEKNRWILEEPEIFDQWGATPSLELNILLNNISYTQSGIELMLKNAKETNNLEDLFLYYEVMGDLYFLKFLLTKKVFNETAGITYLYFATKSYEQSIKNKKLTERKEIYRNGIVGFEYQDILYRLFEEEGIRGDIYNVSSKLDYISKNYKYDVRDLSISSEEKPVDYNNAVLKKISDHLKEISKKNNDISDSHDRAWGIILKKLGIWLYQSFREPFFYRKFAENWMMEREMDLWFSERFLQLVSEKQLSYARESMKGGGKCEHIINNIPIEDKIVDKSDSISIGDFLEEQYRRHYPQVRQYALGESKYAVLLITDVRREVKNCDVFPSAPENCILFKYNEEDNIWCAIFVFQVFLKSPSQLGPLKGFT